MADQPDRRPDPEPSEPGPARLFALVAGGFLALLGTLGFFFDAGFDTGRDLAADDVAGLIVVNGWRNVLYLVTGLVALAFASRRPRRTAAALGGLYLVLGIWGLIETDHDIGSILEVLPLTDEDNVLHLVIGALGLIAALADGPLPKAPGPTRKRAAKRPRTTAAKGKRSESETSAAR